MSVAHAFQAKTQLRSSDAPTLCGRHSFQNVFKLGSSNNTCGVYSAYYTYSTQSVLHFKKGASSGNESLTFSPFFSTVLAVLFTLVDSEIDVCMYVVVVVVSPEIALTVLNC